MKKQRLITSDSRGAFDNKVNNALADGATIVPGTLVCSIAASGTSGTHDVELWAVVVEEPA